MPDYVTHSEIDKSTRHTHTHAHTPNESANYIADKNLDYKVYIYINFEKRCESRPVYSYIVALYERVHWRRTRARARQKIASSCLADDKEPTRDFPHTCVLCVGNAGKKEDPRIQALFFEVTQTQQLMSLAAKVSISCENCGRRQSRASSAI